MEAPGSLVPEMASRKLLVLNFCRMYIERWGAGPSYGEIAAAQGIAPKTARHHVLTLAREGQLVVTRGLRRSITLPDKHGHAIAILRKEGWTVDEDAMLASPPRLLGLVDVLSGPITLPVTNMGLPVPRELDDIPASDGGSDVGDGQCSARAAAGGASGAGAAPAAHQGQGQA